MSTSKISLYSVPDLKATLDDHIPLFLTSPNTTSTKPLARNQLFTQAFTSTYIRLGLGYAAVAIAVYIFYLDYVLKQDWAQTKTVTLFAVIAYTVLNSLLTLWIWFGEKGLVFEGRRIGPSKATALKVWTKAPKQKYDPLYTLHAEWTQNAGESGTVERTVEFMKFFTSDGYFVPEEFEQWLKGLIPVIGQAPVKSEKQKVIQDFDDGDTIVVGGTPMKNETSNTPGGSVETPSKRRTKKKA